MGSMKVGLLESKLERLGNILKGQNKTLKTIVKEEKTFIQFLEKNLNNLLGVNNQLRHQRNQSIRDRTSMSLERNSIDQESSFNSIGSQKNKMMSFLSQRLSKKKRGYENNLEIEEETPTITKMKRYTSYRSKINEKKENNNKINRLVESDIKKVPELYTRSHKQINSPKKNFWKENLKLKRIETDRIAKKYGNYKESESKSDAEKSLVRFQEEGKLIDGSITLRESNTNLPEPIYEETSQDFFTTNEDFKFDLKKKGSKFLNNRKTRSFLDNVDLSKSERKQGILKRKSTLRFSINSTLGKFDKKNNWNNKKNIMITEKDPNIIQNKKTSKNRYRRSINDKYKESKKDGLLKSSQNKKNNFLRNKISEFSYKKSHDFSKASKGYYDFLEGDKLYMNKNIKISQNMDLSKKY